MELTQNYLKSIFKYEPTNGIFICRKKLFRGFAKVGDNIRTSNGRYLYTTIHGVKYAVHRLVFLYMSGNMPMLDVDHIDGDTFNNSFSNLRLCSKQENQRNRCLDKRNNSCFNGVTKFKLTGKWRVRIGLDGKSKHLGLFKTHLAACYSRHAANVKYKFHENHGRSK